MSASFVSDPPAEPRWLNFLCRWGKSNSTKISDQNVKTILQKAFGSFIGALINMATFVPMIVQYFATEDQDGPTPPKTKKGWIGKDAT